jgi:hypothetical protein
MSRQSFAWSIVGATVVFVLGFAASELVPTATGQEILPGGRPAKIQSYYVAATVGDPVVVIPSVPGPHGFILTDIVAHRSESGPGELIVQQGAVEKARILVAGVTERIGAHYHFESGIRLESGEEIKVDVRGGSSPTTYATLSGYSF